MSLKNLLFLTILYNRQHEKNQVKHINLHGTLNWLIPKHEINNTKQTWYKYN